MPDSPVLVHSGIGYIAAISLLALVASFLTLAASIFLLWRYRKAVGRLMASDAVAPTRESDAERGAALTAQASDARREGCVSGSQEREPADILYGRIAAGRWRYVCKHAVGGALFALLLACAGFFAFSQTQVNYLSAAAHPLQFLFLFWTFAWPVVLTTNFFGAVSRRGLWSIAGVYFVVLAALGALVVLAVTEPSVRVGEVSLPAYSAETPLRLIARWSLFNLAPTLLFAAFRYRRVRAVAPLVLSFMTVVAAGVLGVIAAAFYHQELSVKVIASAGETLGVSTLMALAGYFLMLCSIACVLSAALGWRLLARIRSGYQRKKVSDQSLAIDALWLIFATFYAVMLAAAGPGWALAALVAFGLFKLAVRIGNQALAPDGDSVDRGPALLVLRVFALGQRSEDLFEAVTRHWRQVGNVSLIAGTDLALSTVAPHQFLAFVSGRLSQLFIRGEAAIERSVAALDRRRDADGRFRINDFFCHADTWQAVLTRLVRTTEVCLMDLRSFTKDNAGCVFEIEQLLEAVPVERLVFVVDRTTDKRFLEQTWRQACQRLRSDSPNSGLTAGALQPFELSSGGEGELQRLLRYTCAAAGSHRPRLARG